MAKLMTDHRSPAASPPTPAIAQGGPGTPATAVPRQKGSDPRSLMSRFNTAFSLMSIIPLLTCIYLITIWIQKNVPQFSSIQILDGLNGAYFLLALVIALLGLLAGHQLIRDMIRRLLEANTKLEQLYNMQAAFVSNVAHEFRAPLTIFKGALDNLADGLHGPLSADQAEPVIMCQKEVNRLRRLVSDLLEVAQLEAGKLRLQQEEVDLQEMVQSTAQLFSGLLKERGLSLSLDLPDGPVHVIGDRDRLKQVFVNLMGNAVKYTDTGTVRVRLTNDGEVVQVMVEDSGRGIAPQDIARIFDKFERVGVQAEEEGSGLGLPIARDIIALHRGRLWAESELGKGSRFIVRLPLRRGPQ